MGVYISKLRKKLSTVELLEKLDEDIQRLEKLKRTDTERQKRMIASLIIYSVLLYIIIAVVFYFYCMPTQWWNRIAYSLPLLIFPLIVWLLKSFLHWYFVKRIQKNDEVLDKLKEKKKKILEEVMENETYKKAKEILEKFALPPTAPTSKNSSSLSGRWAGEQMQRGPLIQSQLPHSSGLYADNKTPSSPLPVTDKSTGPCATLTSTSQLPTPVGPRLHPCGMTAFQLPTQGPALPRPILPHDRSMLDRLMEYLIGDGPQNRFALICSRCQSHNGMAMREEFEYIARKQKPRAPLLETLSSEELKSNESVIHKSAEGTDDRGEHGEDENVMNFNTTADAIDCRETVGSSQIYESGTSFVKDCELKKIE